MTALAVFPFFLSFVFCGCYFFLWNFPYLGKIIWKACYSFFAIIFFALLQSSCFNLHIYFRLFCQSPIIGMPPLNRNEISLVAIVEPRLQSLLWLIARGDVRLEHCIVPGGPIFQQNPRESWVIILLKKLSAMKAAMTFNFVLCYQDFPASYALRQRKKTQKGFPIKTANVDHDNIINENADAILKQELRSCQHFLVDSEHKRASQKVFNFVRKNLNAEIVHEKFRSFLRHLKVCGQNESSFWIHFKIYTRSRVQIFLRTRKHFLAGSI